jgi:hypothetical protein
MTGVSPSSFVVIFMLSGLIPTIESSLQMKLGLTAIF